MCPEQELVEGNSWFKKKRMCINTHGQNGGRKDGRQGIDGLCVVTCNQNECLEDC